MSTVEGYESPQVRRSGPHRGDGGGRFVRRGPASSVARITASLDSRRGNSYFCAMCTPGISARVFLHLESSAES